MRSGWISVLILSLFVFGIQSLPIEDEQEDDTQNFCGQYAQCRSLAKSQFENCVGGFMEMVLTQSSALSGFKDKALELSHRCEKDLVEAIEQDIKPFYEKIERDTFECTQEATEPKAFSLDESQKIECKLIQTEVRAESFAITGAKSDEECKAVYESQLQRCDLIKSCCPQYNHCRVKAEIENGAQNKEAKLAKKFEHCLEKEDVDYHPKSAPTEPLPVAPEVAENSDDYHVTTIEKRRAPERSTPQSTAAPKTSNSPATPPIGTAPTLATLPPPEKVFNDLVGLLFPGLTTTTRLPPTTTAKALQDKKKADNHGLKGKDEWLNNLKAAKEEHKKAKSNSKPDVSVNKQQNDEKVAEAAPQKNETAKKHSKFGSKAEVVEHIKKTLKEKALKKAAVNSSKNETTVTLKNSSNENTGPSKEEWLQQFSTTTTTTSSPLRVLLATKSQDEIGAMSRMFCEEYLQCQEVVEKQYKFCDEKYQPESVLYGINNHALREDFLKNSKVDDDKIKRRCLDAVDPESQRQLQLLQSVVDGQNAACTRKEDLIPHVTPEHLEVCMNTRLLNVISELFSKDIQEEKSSESGQKCYARVQELQDKCDIIKKCCPQYKFCSSLNHSKESLKFEEIVKQLKDEQSLCEKRRIRILNGLV